MNNKHAFFLLVVVLMASVLAACGSQAAPASSSSAEAYTSQVLDTSYDGAMPVRNQLALGTLKLAGTAVEVTSRQAGELLPLWQALRSTSQTGGSAQIEVNALLGQIEGVMNADQLAAIRDLKLVQADIQAWASANGITLGSGSSQPGSGQGLSPEAKATRQAAEGRTPGSSGGASTAIIDAVITYLESRAR